MGLCFGGGQIILGSVAAVLGFLVLSTLHWVEARLDEQQQATLSITIVENCISEEELRTMLETAKVRVRSISIIKWKNEQQEKFECDVRWPAHKDTKKNPAILNDIAQLRDWSKCAGNQLALRLPDNCHLRFVTDSTDFSDKKTAFCLRQPRRHDVAYNAHP